jgi:DHA2 family multidrug resistance protein-like MFS transporter
MAVASVLSAMVLVVLDAATATVALPAIAGSFQVSPARAVDVVTAYQLGLVMALLPVAALGESLGYRRVFKTGVALFAAASLGCSLAPSLYWLIAARLVQGLGGAAVMSLGVALLRQIVPPAQLGAAIAWNALAVALSSATGPALGSLILSISSWQWLFTTTRPIALIALILARALPNIPGNGRRVDLASAALNAGALGAIVVASQFVMSQPALAISLFAVGIAGLAVLVHRELPQASPLIPFDLLSLPSFRVSVVASVFCFAAQTAGLIALPFYLERNLQQGGVMTGLLVTAWPLTVALAAPLAVRFAVRIDGGLLCAAGGALLSAGLLAIALLPTAHALHLVPFIMLCGVGFGLFQISNNRSMFLSAPTARSGAAGGLQGTARLTGQTVGAIVLSLLFASYAPIEVPSIAMVVGGSFAFIAGIVSTLRYGNRADVEERQ